MTPSAIRRAVLAQPGTRRNEDGSIYATCVACGSALAVLSADDELTCESGCAPDVQELAWLERYGAEGRDERGNGSAPRAPTSWAPVELERIIEGGDPEEPPTLLARTDGPCLIYAGKSHTFLAEPEGCTGWAALHTTTGALGAGEHVIYIDCEDTAGTAVARLLALRVPPEAIIERFHYVRPDEPLDERGWRDLGAALARHPTIVVIDGVTEALAIHGLNLTDNLDVAKWLELMVRPFLRAGVAVLLLDHVTKDRESRGRFAIGAQHKLAGVDVAYGFEVREPFGRGREGLVKVKVLKDRPGHVRQHALEGRIADMRLTSHADGEVSVELEPPTAPGETFRPTVLMERVSRALEATPGLSKRAVRSAVAGRNDTVDLALELLISDGHVEARPAGRATAHHAIRPYREEEDGGDRAHVPDRAPSVPGHTAEANVPTCPPPLGGHGTGHGASDPNDNDGACPDVDEAQAELDRLREKGLA